MSTQFSEAEWNEFKHEAEELIDRGEAALLATARGESFINHYDDIFRALHNLKGAAGMFRADELRDHFHQLENIFSKRKNDSTLDCSSVTFFLSGFDAARKMLAGQKIPFSYVIGAPSVPNFAATPAPIFEDAKLIVVGEHTSFIEELLERLSARNIRHRYCNNAEEFLASPRLAGDEIILVLSELDEKKLRGEPHKLSPTTAVLLVAGMSANAIVEVGKFALDRARHAKVLDEAIELILLQYSEVDDFLISSGKEALREKIRSALDRILSKR